MCSSAKNSVSSVVRSAGGIVSVGCSETAASSSSSSGLGREEGVSVAVVVVVVREDEGAGAGLAREVVLPVEGRWGLKGLVFEVERSGGMVSDGDIGSFGG